ncbi:cyclodeaminase/cyclohydrolase family protein [Glutamicibacter sp.]|uniref:cyclodeaminase/cyclohydrolase family protein n=1 Tax=Glutamicibacter sp. TaxID=1931995 RepID=UPI002B45FCA5|nr:cyclodeaminase/cyclohydrolase family protein [Glutamicibacter sp.]HJX77092.1 cyclodeaminase/cyclohydrolase family protein [Glutamicibacter sp.]
MSNSTITGWLNALSISDGAPGGGAACGIMLAIAASLTSMVCGYTSTEDHEQQVTLSLIDSRAKELKDKALKLGDQDAAVTNAFGAAFRMEQGPDRQQAVKDASIQAAKASAALGELAITAIADLQWLAEYGNRALIADVAVALGALRAAVTGARTNVSFDLSKVATDHTDLAEVRDAHPQLWQMVQQLTGAQEEIDRIAEGIDHRAAPTDSR